MKHLTITIEEGCGGGYDYHIYTCDAGGVQAGMDSVARGMCDGTIEDAVGVAGKAAEKVLRSNRAGAPEIELIEQLLEIIDNADGMSRSDLQGTVDAFVRGHCTLTA